MANAQMCGRLLTVLEEQGGQAASAAFARGLARVREQRWFPAVAAQADNSATADGWQLLPAEALDAVEVLGNFERCLNRAPAADRRIAYRGDAKERLAALQNEALEMADALSSCRQLCTTTHCLPAACVPTDDRNNQTQSSVPPSPLLVQGEAIKDLAAETRERLGGFARAVGGGYSPQSKFIHQFLDIWLFPGQGRTPPGQLHRLLVTDAASAEAGHLLPEQWTKAALSAGGGWTPWLEDLGTLSLEWELPLILQPTALGDEPLRMLVAASSEDIVGYIATEWNCGSTGPARPLTILELAGVPEHLRLLQSHVCRLTAKLRRERDSLLEELAAREYSEANGCDAAAQSQVAPRMWSCLWHAPARTLAPPRAADHVALWLQRALCASDVVRLSTSTDPAGAAVVLLAVLQSVPERTAHRGSCLASAPVFARGGCESKTGGIELSLSATGRPDTSWRPPAPLSRPLDWLANFLGSKETTCANYLRLGVLTRVAPGELSSAALQRQQQQPPPPTEAARKRSRSDRKGDWSRAETETPDSYRIRLSTADNVTLLPDERDELGWSAFFAADIQGEGGTGTVAAVREVGTEGRALPGSSHPWVAELLAAGPLDGAALSRHYGLVDWGFLYLSPPIPLNRSVPGHERGVLQRTLDRSVESNPGLLDRLPSAVRSANRDAGGGPPAKRPRTTSERNSSSPTPAAVYARF